MTEAGGDRTGMISNEVRGGGGYGSMWATLSTETVNTGGGRVWGIRWEWERGILSRIL